MKLFVIACVLVVSQAAPEGGIHAKWAAFKAQHGKQFHVSLEAQKLKNFEDNDKFIQEHNAAFERGEVNFRVRHNALSDMSRTEFRSKMLGKKSISLQGRNISHVPAMTMPSLPPRVDWREKGIVTPPKNQQQCGSCYAFGTVGVVESEIFKKDGKMLDLAEQQVVDCSLNYQNGMNGGCNGGHEVVTMDWISANGLVEESSYRYTSGTTKRHGTCQKRTGPYGKGLKYRGVKPGDEKAVAEALAQYGTLVISISGENPTFQFFEGGRIFDDPRCSKNVDHVISLVGYGTEGGVDYWIVKNSWGTSWADGGFGKVKRGVNQCGIVSDYSWSIYF